MGRITIYTVGHQLQKALFTHTKLISLQHNREDVKEESRDFF